MKTIQILWAAVAIVLLQACSVNTENTYYRDASTSMTSKILLDKSTAGMMSMAGKGSGMPDISKLSTEWRSLYDIQKDNLINLNSDSAKVLKKLYLKADKENGEILGISMKYDKLLPEELESLFGQSRQLRSIPLQHIAQWDGSTLKIDTQKFSSVDFLSKIERSASEPQEKPATKSDSIQAYGRQMAQGMVGMLRMFNVNFTSTLKFQQPIKSISGKHDFVKQIDDRTVQISVRSSDLLNEDRKLQNADRLITISTK